MMGEGAGGGLAHDDLLGFTLDPVRVGDGVGQGRDGVQLLVGFGSCEDWLDNAVVDSFDESPGRIGSVLLLASTLLENPAENNLIKLFCTDYKAEILCHCRKICSS